MERDYLTNLPSRRSLYQYYNGLEESDRVHGMFLDVDNYKRINDFFGHSMGDRLMVCIGKFLHEHAKGFAARVGGDEFHVIAGDYSIDECERFIASVLEYMKGYNEVNSMPFRVEISYGSVLIEEFEVGNLEYYLNISDNRMYKQKFKKKKSRGMSEY